VAMSIRNHKAESLARELAQQQNVSMTQAIIEALEQQKARLEHRRCDFAGTERARLIKIQEIAHRCASLPDLDVRSPDEILGYGEHGLSS
jgi:antitoxin VapB